ncbi:MAG: 4'-phosphopantetheinyl transferase family protein [Steroidobacteraceae bacterium]
MDTDGSIQRSLAIAGLFPEPVAAFESRGPIDPRVLAPEEAAHVARAVPKRVNEFAAGRACARRALAELGVPDFILRVGPDREPLWPPGIAGSITHTDEYCAAAAARTTRFAAIGLDAERRDAVHPRLWRQIATSEEIVWLESLAPDQAQAMGTLIFSAKEAFYKCQFALTREWLNFSDVTLTVEADGFQILPRRRLALEALTPAPWLGRHLLEHSRVLAGCGLPARLVSRTHARAI